MISCAVFLPMSGCSGAATGIALPLLVAQIFGLVLVGAIFAFLAVFGLVRGIDYRDRKWWPLVPMGICGTFYFFYWGAVGFPLFGQYWIVPA